MKRVSILFIIMLLILSNGYAEGNEADHWEKIRQLNQLAEKFKAETGFEGAVIHSTTTMKLHVYRGNFPDISFSADGDSTAFRQACEAIINKILPYSRANKNQLSMSYISKIVGTDFKTNYYQQVNGYRVESSGIIAITYDKGNKRFSISDKTQELPERVTINITLDQAIEKAEEIYKPKQKYDKNLKYYDARTDLVFTNNPENPEDKQYRLNYKISYWGVTYYIDPATGNVSYTRSLLIKNHHGQAYGYLYKADYTSSSIDTLGYKGLYKVSFEQQNDGFNYQYMTDMNGEVLLNEITIDSLNVSLTNRELYRLVEYPDTLHAVVADTVYVVQDSLYAVFMDNNAFSSNVYHHITNQYYALKELNDFNTIGYRIITNMPGNNFYNGIFDPNRMAIRLTCNAGKFSHVARHEMSHAAIYSWLGDNLFAITNDENFHCMDEALAVYLPCSVLNSQYYIPSSNSIYSLNNVVHIDTQHSNVNEEQYSYYESRYPLASAWWALRSDSNFGSTAVDTLLVKSLNLVNDEIDFNHAYRYKPRYFYNILMSKVDTDKQSWPFNDKQTAINDVYSARGFHFYPKVQSVASASVAAPLARESFNVLDSVYVHISNCPQNTYVQVFVVEDRDYYELGADGIDIPAPYEVNGNPVSGIFKTNSDGKWAGSIPFSRLLPQGDYDIIVNVGSPSAPDNKLHLVFAKDNIIDGVDGLDGPGFTKVGTGDIVVALDLSSSMSGYGDQLAQMAKALQQSMLDTERINVFGFTEGTASQGWIEDGITDLIGDENSFLEAGQIDSTYVTNVLNSIQIDGNTDLVLPFHHGASRLNNLGDTGNRNGILPKPRRMFTYGILHAIR